MNLRVDLIMDNEKRSANVLNVKSLIRIGSIVIPLWLVVSVAVSILNLINVKSNEKNLVAKWDHTKPRKEAAVAQRKQRNTTKTILNELKGWKASHIDWHKQLSTLQRQVPRGIKFDNLNISQTLGADDKSNASRTFLLVINGQAKGKNSEYNLQLLKRRIVAAPSFAEEMENVDMQGWTSTLENASEEDREFRIKCKYQQRMMEAPKK